jgi:hypothetical protein
MTNNAKKQVNAAKEHPKPMATLYPHSCIALVWLILTVNPVIGNIGEKTSMKNMLKCQQQTI